MILFREIIFAAASGYFTRFFFDLFKIEKTPMNCMTVFGVIYCILAIVRDSLGGW